MTYFTPIDFIRESNRIEGIKRNPTEAEIEEYRRFMAQDEIAVKDMIAFVATYQADARLRDRQGLNVFVGNHVPPAGGITIKTRLMDILDAANRMRKMFKSRAIESSAYDIHHRYEQLHPFTDGNGRSGRMLWMWMMQDAPLGFLHHWYYQSLASKQER